MKKLIFLMTFAFVALMGCKKEDANLPDSSTENRLNKDAGISLYSVDLDGDFSRLKTIIFQESELASRQNLTPRGSANASVNGHYNSITGNAIHTFSGALNKGGIHGQGNLNGPEDGWDLEYKTVCLEVEGNKAVVGGQITRVNHLPAGAEEAFAVDNYLYFYVEDHGEGAKDASDRYERRIYWSPAADGPLCFVVPPSNALAWGEYVVDVAKESDQVQVKD